MSIFSPREIVSELDRFIVGQKDAQRAVAIALRKRWRRQHLTGDMKNEVKIDYAEITISTKIGDTAKDYALAAEEATESDPPQASRFGIEDKSLVVALEAAGKEGTSATLKLKIKGKDFAQEIKHEEHHH